MAESYINALSGDFEPEEFADEYRGALEQLIEAKVAGREMIAPLRSRSRPAGRRPDGRAAPQRRRGQGPPWPVGRREGRQGARQQGSGREEHHEEGRQDSGDEDGRQGHQEATSKKAGATKKTAAAQVG